MNGNVLLVGVGGQGTILAGKLLTAGLVQAGFDVKMSEIHGMSQRGGSVTTQVRWGERVEAPTIEPGTAGLLVGFELMEALRWVHCLRPDGIALVNDYRINPMPVVAGAADYPDDIAEKMAAAVDLRLVDAFGEAKALGNAKALNTLLLGAAVELLGLEQIDWDAVVEHGVRERFRDVNRCALSRGRELVRSWAPPTPATFH